MVKIDFQGINLIITDAMQEYFERKIQRAILHAGNTIKTIRVNFEVEHRTDSFHTEIIVGTTNNKTLRHKTNSIEMYACIDIACAGIERQIRKHKEKVKQNRISTEGLAS